jgi:hypothetical protein
MHCQCVEATRYMHSREMVTREALVSQHGAASRALKKVGTNMFWKQRSTGNRKRDTSAAVCSIATRGEQLKSPTSPGWLGCRPAPITRIGSASNCETTGCYRARSPNK